MHTQKQGFNLNVIKTLTSTRFFLFILMILSIPYYIAPSFLLLLSIVIFLITIYLDKVDLKSLFIEKTILFLFSFISMTYISFLWSPAEHIFGGNLKVNIMAYLNFFFIIPAIYFSSFSKKQIKIFFLFIIISPSIYILTYYTNYFNITNIISLHMHPNGNKHLYVNLFSNLFILYTGGFFYIHFLLSLIKKEYKKSIFYSIIFILVSISMVLTPATSSRLVTLAYLISLIFSSIFILSKKTKFFVLITVLVLSSTFLYQSEKFQKGFHEFQDTYEKNEYEGSWGHRIKLAQYGLEMFIEYPIFGRGTVDIIDNMRRLREENPKDFHDATIHFHNQHIVILVQVGLVGYTLFLFFMYNLYRFQIKDKVLATLKRITVVMFMTLMMGEHYLQWVHTTTYLAVLTSLFLLYKKRELLETIS